MKSINIDLPRDLDVAEIHTFADLHIGDKACDIDTVRRRIEYVKNTPNAYCILNGDVINNATKTSVSDCYAERYSPMQQLEMFVDLFSGIKDRIIGITQGNHENRTYIKEGIDLTAVAAKELGILDRYSKAGAVIFIKIGNQGKSRHNKPVVYTLDCIHGSGGGRKEGAKAIRLADMSAIVDADIYIHSHTHLPMIIRQAFYRTNPITATVTCVDKLYVNTSASLDYGGYGEVYEFKPASKECPVIYISGVRRDFYAKL